MDDVSQVQWDQPQASAQPVPQVSQSPQDVSQLPQDMSQSVQWDEDKYGTPEQMLKTGAEGLSRGILGSTITNKVEKELGIKEEDIKARHETNPIASGVGQAAGLGAGMLTGVGEGALMEEAGNLASKAVGLGEPVSYAAKVGSEAVNQAAQMAILQSDDEMAKHVINDPEASTDSAIANIGMAAALGGAGGAFVGAVSPLWKMSVGNRLESALEGLTNELGGQEGKGVAEDIAKSGLQVPDTIHAVLTNDLAKNISSGLEQTDSTYFGKLRQKELKAFEEQSANKVVETLGKNPEELHTIPELDKYAIGKKMADTLASEIKYQAEPINNAYEKYNEYFKQSPVLDAAKRDAADQIARKSLEEGWNKSESEANAKFAQKVISKLNAQETVQDLKQFISNLRKDHPWGTETYGAAKDISKILTQTQERTILDNIVKQGGGEELGNKLVAEYNTLKSGYKGLMDRIDNLNEHLHIGKYEGPQSFLHALNEFSTTSGEQVLNRLVGTSKANVLDVLAKDFPDTLAKVKAYHVDKLLADAVSKAQPGSKININNLLKNIEKMSPQVKQLIADEEQHSRIQAIDSITNRLKDNTHNWSNTARTIDKITHGAVGPIPLISALMGHAGLGIAAHIGRLGLTEGKDAIKYGMIKFLSSNQPAKAEGFKSMVNFIQNSIKGQNMLAQASKAVFKSGAQVLTDKQMPNQASLDKLDKAVAKINQSPDSLVSKSATSPVGHYLPDHQVALSAAQGRTVQYLQQLKPKPIKLSPLDHEIEPSKADMARYGRALTIAQQPAVILQHIKDGTIQTSDLADLNALYPSLYKQMSQQLSNAMISHHADDGIIPYKTRLGVSLFLGQPIDSTMAPASIIAAQPKPQQAPQQPQKAKGSPQKLGKSNSSYMTADQIAESRRNKD